MARAWPTALGVASADLTFATLAAFSGAALSRALQPYTTVMRFVAATLLVTLAAVMFRKAVTEISRYRSGPDEFVGRGAAAARRHMVAPCVWSAG